MTQPARVIYLPPGVASVPTAQATPTTGVPFDRGFFVSVLPAAVNAFCQQVECVAPMVELLTVDGVTHHVIGVSGVADQWVALHTSDPDHDTPAQAFVAYQTIFRVEIHAGGDAQRRHLGFVITEPEPPAQAEGEGAAPSARARRSERP